MSHWFDAVISAVALAALCQASVCNLTSIQDGMDHGGRDYASFVAENVSVCQQRCCEQAASGCRAFTWTSFQPHNAGQCQHGTACCWLKHAKLGDFVPKTNCSSGELVDEFSVSSPRLTHHGIIARDESGALRDPSAMIQDPATGHWHFWVVYIPGVKNHDGWAGYLHHWSAENIDGPFVNRGLALNHSMDPDDWDSHGMFSPSAIYDKEQKLWFLFYSGTGTNHNWAGHSCAQLVASSTSPEGPWSRLGLVATPTGKGWNTRCVDSGRAMVVNGQRGWWTNGVRGGAIRVEGAYFPVNSSSFAPPFMEWSGNPIYRIDGSSGPYNPQRGFENCEFFMGPARETTSTPSGQFLHVWCNSHTGEGQPHWVMDPSSTALRWTYVEMLPKNGNWADGALEPTPVYSDTPGDASEVTHFIARTVDSDGRLTVGLYALDWVQLGAETISV